MKAVMQKTLTRGAVAAMTTLWLLQSDVAGTARLEARAQLNVWQQQIVNQLEDSRLLRFYLDNGFVLQQNTALLGYLGRSQRENRVITFETGYQHVLIGKCDNDCDDFDLALYDPNGNLVGEDVRGDDTPLIKFIPRARGDYTVRASMPGCTALVGCHWGAIVASSR